MQNKIVYLRIYMKSLCYVMFHKASYENTVTQKMLISKQGLMHVINALDIQWWQRQADVGTSADTGTRISPLLLAQLSIAEFRHCSWNDTQDPLQNLDIAASGYIFPKCFYHALSCEGDLKMVDEREVPLFVMKNKYNYLIYPSQAS